MLLTIAKRGAHVRAATHGDTIPLRITVKFHNAIEPTLWTKPNCARLASD